MGRLSATNATEVNAASLRRVLLVSLAYPSGTLYLADQTAPGLTYGGQTYVGDGTLIDCGDVAEKSDLTPSALRLRLSASNLTLLARFRDDNWHRSLVQFAVGFLDANGVFVDTPASLGSWYMSGGGMANSVIEQYCESFAVDLYRPSLLTPSDADQKVRYPGDTFFTNVPALEEKEIEWGGRRQTARSTNAGGVPIATGFGGVFGLYGSGAVNGSREVFDSVSSGQRGV